MSSYTAMQSVILDPYYHSNKRTEFKLFNRNRQFSPKLRLVNFGVSATTPAGLNVDSFNIAGGILSIIKNIYLYFDDILVDQIKDANQYLPIKNLSKKAYTTFRDVDNKTKCSNLNLQRSEVDPTELDLVEPSGKLLGYLDLTEVFPLLSVLNSSAIKLAGIMEIRVSIEYETNADKMFIEERPTAFTINQPEIIYDEYFGMEVANNGDFTVNINAVENERFVLAGNNNKQSVRVRAFDGKYLMSVLFQNVLNANLIDDDLCVSKSDVLQNEKVNLMIDGSSLINFQGSDNDAKKLAFTVDSLALGNYFAPTGTTMDNVDAGQFVKYGAELQNVVGHLSYLGLNIMRSVGRIYYEVSYNGTGQGPCTVFVYGQVLKAVVKRGSTYLTSYINQAGSM